MSTEKQRDTQAAIGRLDNYDPTYGGGGLDISSLEEALTLLHLRVCELEEKSGGSGD